MEASQYIELAGVKLYFCDPELDDKLENMKLNSYFYHILKAHAS